VSDIISVGQFAESSSLMVSRLNYKLWKGNNSCLSYASPGNRLKTSENGPAPVFTSTKNSQIPWLLLNVFSYKMVVLHNIEAFPVKIFAYVNLLHSKFMNIQSCHSFWLQKIEYIILLMIIHQKGIWEKNYPWF